MPYCSLAIPEHLLVKKSLVPAFSIGHKGHFSKILNRIFKFGCFSKYHAQIFDKNEFDVLMQNVMLNRLA